MTEAIIFDWGGVLMRTEDYSPRHKWDRRLHLPPGSTERVVHGITAWKQVQQGDITIEEYWQAVGSALNLSPSALSALRRDFYSGDRLDENLVDLVRRLSDAGLLTGLLSNNSLDLIDTLSGLGLSDLFTACVISAKIGVMKPDAAAYHFILDKLNVAPRNAILIDDSLQNVEGAQAIGMQAIHFTSDFELSAAIQSWLDG